MYIHKMAQFRVLKQTKQQCEHFVTGFRSIVNPKWLTLFSIQELQYLISGQTTYGNARMVHKTMQANLATSTWRTFASTSSTTAASTAITA